MPGTGLYAQKRVSEVQLGMNPHINFLNGGCSLGRWHKIGLSVATDWEMPILRVYSALIIAELSIPCIIRDPGQQCCTLHTFPCARQRAVWYWAR